MAEKKTQLSIVLRTVDQATARINAIVKRIDAVTKPIRDFREALGDLREKSGLDEVIGGFKGVGGAIAGILGKVAMIGGVVGGAVAGLFHLVDGFDDLGDKAEAMGVSVDFLAQMRYAAERSGASVEALDGGLQGFAKSLGMARANGGPLVKWLGTVSPALLQQLKAAKSNEAAFRLLADAMIKIKDPAKRAAFAQKTLGDASLAPLLAKGGKGIDELRDRYAELAGSQQGAADEAGKVDDAMKDFKATIDGIKAALVQGLAPALTVIVEQLSAWFQGNRARVAEFAASLGKRIPGAVAKLVDTFSGVVDAIKPFVDTAGKLKVIAAAVAAIIVGPLVASIYSLGAALLATPVGWIVAGIAAIAAGAYLLIDNWDAVTGFFVELWDTLGEKFGIARDIAALVLAPFIYLPAKIIANWDSITTFFAELWDGVTGVFKKAWDFIKGIVDKVAGAVDTVVGGIDAIGGFFRGDEQLDLTKIAGAAGLDVSGQAQAALAAGRASSQEARVTVDFANAPRGTRVQADPQSTASVDLSVGYQMLGAM